MSYKRAPQIKPKFRDLGQLNGVFHGDWRLPMFWFCLFVVPGQRYLGVK